MDNDKKEISKILEEKIQISINKREDLSSENLRLAEQISFKNLPDKVTNTDQYGFLKDPK